ncbi:hypothetical protein TNCV_2009181 [Trichonephila clavipes]|nr:hypothetical protein TNCV_2009181 [Trichonephila clavipes]
MLRPCGFGPRIIVSLEPLIADVRRDSFEARVVSDNVFENHTDTKELWAVVNNNAGVIGAWRSGMDPFGGVSENISGVNVLE